VSRELAEEGYAWLYAIAGRIAVCGTVATLAIWVTAAEADQLGRPTSPSTSLYDYGRARPISGWVDFCKRFPAECRSNRDEPRTITFSEQVWDLLVTTNTKVNSAIKPLTDESHWGVADRWDLPKDGLGDCEDYQLLKRKLLAETGLPRRAMRMTVVIDDKGDGHAVLAIRTDRGDFILDNRTNSVLPWTQTGYLFVKREGDSAGSWVSLGGVGSPVATAAR
jgi:predicted transglutaminase-like cysteine proteinase